MSKISDASEVIADYCETGGVNTHGGTGLKDPATLVKEIKPIEIEKKERR